MVLSQLISLFILLLVLALGLDGWRAREQAIRIARQSCQGAGYQFLDDSVYRQQLHFRWTKQGLRLVRQYGFEYSIEPARREHGHVIMAGQRPIAVYLDGRLTWHGQS